MTAKTSLLALAASVIACVLPVTPVLAQTPVQSEPLTLDAAVERALAANPAIAAARQRRLVGVAELDVAREHPNPEARVEFERETPHQAFSLAFPLETGGKRDKRTAVANAAIRTSDAELMQVMAEVRASVRRAYFERLIAESRLMLQEELQALAGRFRDAAQQRFDAGDAPRLEVLQADLGLAEAQNQTNAAGGAAAAARARLNALLTVPLDTQMPLATSLDGPVPAPTETAIARAKSASAELALLDRRLDEQRTRIALAQAMRAPDVTPEATITHGNQPEFSTGWRAAVAVAVPLFTSHRAAVRLEEATLTQLTLERDAAVTRISGDVTSAAVLADSQRQQYVRYRDQIIPQAVEVERMAEDSYRLGQTGITALLQALQMSRDVRLRSLQAAADFQSALAELERAIGAPLP